MGNYSIKQLETLSGIKAHTLRIWEQRYDLLKPKRTDTNIRFYDDDQLKLLLNISLLVNNGYKISKIANLGKDKINYEVSELYNVCSDDKICEEGINGLVVAMIDFNESLFSEIVKNFMLKIGMEKTMTQLVYPFLHKVGILWVTDELSPSQEHFSSNLIKQKLHVAIDSISNSSLDNKDSYLLFLKEGEFHEIALLFASYILKSNGKKVYYLGANVPKDSLEEAVKEIKPRHLMTFFIKQQDISEVREYMNSLNKMFPKGDIFVSGSKHYFENTEKLGGNIQFIESIDAFTSTLSK